MTYTDAAIEVLRRIGKPTHFKEIAAQALADNLLSHVGGTPEATMGTRLLAMAVKDADRRVVATEPGVFALAEWDVVPASAPSLDESGETADDAPAHRPRERHPPLQEEMLVGGRREERRRRSDVDDEGKRKKRYPPPAEVALAWLAEHGGAATLAVVAAGLRAADRIAEALERDLGSFEKALRQENRRRAQTHRPAPFEFRDDGTVAIAEAKAERTQKKEPRARSEKSAAEPSSLGADEQRKAVLRAVRRRLSALDVAALERVVVAWLETQGHRDLNMARRSAKDGALYLCRHRHGAGELRYAVRVQREGRDLGREEVQDVRRDAAHFSAQMGIVVGNAECTREARSEANAPSGTPVILYGNEALAEALVEAGLGATRRVIEWLDYDDDFFVSMGADESPESSVEVDMPDGAEAVVANDASEASDDVKTRSGREEGRGRRRRGRRRGSSAAVDGSQSSEVAPQADSSPPEEATTPSRPSEASEPRSNATEPSSPPAAHSPVRDEENSQ